MLATIKRLALGISLIGLAAGILLYSDLDSRKSSRTQAGMAKSPDKVLRAALVQQASITALEEGATGVVAALAERGYEDGDRLELKRYNAEADIGTGLRPIFPIKFPLFGTPNKYDDGGPPTRGSNASGPGSRTAAGNEEASAPTAATTSEPTPPAQNAPSAARKSQRRTRN